MLASLMVWVGAPSHAAAVTPTDSAVDIALALVDDTSYLVGSEIVTAPPTSGSLAIADEAIGGLPAGSVVMSSGRASRITEANTSGSSGGKLGGGSIRGNTDRDVTVVRVDLDVPDWVNCIVGIDFQFFSEEHPEYVGSGFNDGFIIELDESTWTTSGSQIIAPRNIRSTRTARTGVERRGLWRWHP